MDFWDMYEDRECETKEKVHQRNKKKKMDAYLEKEREEQNDEFVRD